MRELWEVKPGSKVDISTLDPATPEPLKGGRKPRTLAALEHDQRGAHRAADASLGGEPAGPCCSSSRAPTRRARTARSRTSSSGVNPQGTRVTSFKAPTAEELAHDFLWRVHAAMPRAGEIGIFNRSHYEDVLVARVRKLVPKTVWKHRYDDIIAFESLLAQGGTRSSNAVCSSARTSSAGASRSASTTRRNAGSSSAATSRIVRCGSEYQARLLRRDRAHLHEGGAVVHHPVGHQVVSQLGGEPPAHRDAHGR